MNVQNVIDYVMHTPDNTNPAILRQMIRELDCSTSEDEQLFIFKDNIKDLFQWSTGVVLVFDKKYVAEEVHFSNDKVNAYRCAIDKNGEVTIPDFLLQKANPLEVYLMLPTEDGSYTKVRRIIRVLARPKPDNYVSGEEEIKIWDTKLDIYQGAENVGKILTIDQNGMITYTDFSSVGDDKNFIFTQNTASDVWTINHNLNKFPSVTIVDSANSVVIGEINYIDLNNLKISFSGAFSGKAYLN